VAGCAKGGFEGVRFLGGGNRCEGGKCQQDQRDRGDSVSEDAPS
jgi:hypothetical protein